MSIRKRQILLVALSLLAVLVADQVSKAIILHTVEKYSVSPEGRETTFFYITHERNPGLVGGMFRDRPVVAMVAPILATLVLAYLFTHLDPSSRVQSVAFGMIAGGAFGNIIDRLRLGEVVDFLQFQFYFIPFDFPWKRYPAFNLADTGICTGVFLLVVTWIWFDRKAHQANVANPA